MVRKWRAVVEYDTDNVFVYFFFFSYLKNREEHLKIRRDSFLWQQEGLNLLSFKIPFQRSCLCFKWNVRLNFMLCQITGVVMQGLPLNSAGKDYNVVWWYPMFSWGERKLCSQDLCEHQRAQQGLRLAPYCPLGLCTSRLNISWSVPLVNISIQRK